MRRPLPRWAWPLILLGILFLAGLYVWAFRQAFTSKVPGANDFFSPYGAAYVYWKWDWNPYSQQATQWMQLMLHGRLVEAGEITNDFVYPFYTLLIVSPYLILPDYAWVQAAWQVTLQIMLIAAFLLLLRYVKWSPRPVTLAILLLWMLALYPTARALILGQMSIPVYFLTVIVLWLLFRGDNDHRARRDGLAGFLLALSTMKPQMQFLIIPFLILWGIRDRRWAFVVSSAGSMLFLMSLSFLMLPTWLVDWLAQLRAYPGYTPPTVFYILTREVLLLGGVAPVVEGILTAAFAVYLLYEWWRVIWRRDRKLLDWTIALTLTLTHLIALRTATTHYIVFFLPLLMVFSAWRDRPWWIIITSLVLFVGLWALFVVTLDGNQESNLVFVPLPLIVFGLLIAIRPEPDLVLSGA